MDYWTRNGTVTLPPPVGSRAHYQLSWLGRAPFWAVTISSTILNGLVVVLTAHPRYINGAFKWFVLNTAVWDGSFSATLVVFSLYEILHPHFTSVVYCTLLDHFRACILVNGILSLALSLGSRYVAICREDIYGALTTTRRLTMLLVGTNGALILISSGRLIELLRFYRDPYKYKGFMGVRTCGLAVTYPPNVVIAVVVVVASFVSGIVFTIKTLRQINYMRSLVSKRALASRSLMSTVAQSRRLMLTLLLQASAAVSCAMPMWVVYMMFVRHNRDDNTATAIYVYVAAILLCLPTLIDAVLVLSLMPQYRNTMRLVVFDTVWSTMRRHNNTTTSHQPAVVNRRKQ